MSLLSSEVAVAALHPQGVDFLRAGRRGRKPWGALQQQRLAVVGESPAGLPLWQPALEKLDEIERPAGKRGQPLRLVLSNHFVRYLLLPWEQVVSCQGRVAMLARARFGMSYGDAAAGWHVEVESPRPGQPCLAAAIDAELFVRTREKTAALGYSLVSLRPYLVTAMRVWQQTTKAPKNDWFAAWEPGRLAVCGRAGVFSTRLTAADALLPALRQCLATGRLGGAGHNSVVMHAPGWQGEWPAADGVERFDAGVPGSKDCGQAMAWSGVA